MDKEQLQAKLTEIFELKFKDNFKSEFDETSGFKKVNVCYLHDFFEAGCEARQLEIDLLQDEVEQSKLAYESLHKDYIQAVQEVRIAHENHSESVESLQAEVERLKSEQPEWIPCCESAPGIEHSDVQGKVWFSDGSNVRRIPYYCLKGCADYSGTLEYKHGFWMAIPRASKPKPPVKAKEASNVSNS